MSNHNRNRRTGERSSIYHAASPYQKKREEMAKEQKTTGYQRQSRPAPRSQPQDNQREVVGWKYRRRGKMRLVLFSAMFVMIFFVGLVATYQIFGKDSEEDVATMAPVNVADENSTTSNSDSPESSESTVESGGDQESSSSPTESSSQSGQTPAANTATSNYERVVNRTYPIEPNYIAGTGVLVDIEGKQLESQAADALRDMLQDLRSTGMDVILQSAYRTDGDQEYLYNRQIGRQGGDEIKAATISAVPLTSEHQMGLAVDLSVDGNLDESFAETPQGQWLAEHCAEYGYIKRYTEDKMKITGIIWEPWHFRYVGSPQLAQEITNSGLCMEEYYGKYLAPEDLDPYLDYLQ